VIPAVRSDDWSRPRLCENATVDMRHVTICSPHLRHDSKYSTRRPVTTRKCSLSLRYDVFTQPGPKAAIRRGGVRSPIPALCQMHIDDRLTISCNQRY
jgi:hypothetical protein